MKQSPRVTSPSPPYHQHQNQSQASSSQTNSTSTSSRQPLMRYTTSSRRSSAVNYSKGTTTNDVFLLQPQPQQQSGSGSHSPPPPLKPQVFNRSMNKNPNFEKDFGPFGTVVSDRGSSSLGGKDQGDINSMFSRVGVNVNVVDRASGARLSGGFRVMDDDATSVTPGWGVSKDPLPPTNTPPIGVGVQSGRNRTHDQLDRILAKYGKDLKDQADHNGERERELSVRVHGGYWDAHPQHHPVEVNVSPGRRRIIVHAQAHKQMDMGMGGDLNGNLPPEGEEEKKEEQPVVLRRSTHVFPFKETPTGLLVVDANQIAFENRKLSVLVADPNSNIIGNDSMNKHERLLQEVRRAMSLAIDSSTGGGGMGGDDKDKCKALQGKELMSKKYSESKKATEEFEQKLLQRLVQGRNSDTHVIIGDKVFPCHGVALEVFSSYFDKLGREQQTIQKVQLNEQEVSPQAFQTIMNWMFQSEDVRKSLVTKENLVQLYTASRHLGVKDLELQCITFVERKLDYTDPDLLNIWDGVKQRQHSCPDLFRIIGSKLAASFKDIFSTKKYLTMEIEELHMLLSSDDIAIDNEMDVYNSAVTWLVHDFKTRKIHTNRLMSTVRFGLLTPLQLTQINLCPEINKFKCEKDYNQVLAYGTVKSMIDDGLSYSILVESYRDQPEELQQWIEKTGVKTPAPRNVLERKKLNPLIQEKISLLEDASQTKLRSSKGQTHAALNLNLKNSSSYTIIEGGNRGSNPEKESSPVHEISKPKLLTNSSGLLINITDRDRDRDNHNEK